MQAHNKRSTQQDVAAPPRGAQAIAAAALEEAKARQRQRADDAIRRCKTDPDKVRAAHDAVERVGNYLVDLLAATEMLENYMDGGGADYDSGGSAIQTVTALASRIRADARAQEIIVYDDANALAPGDWHIDAQDGLFELEQIVRARQGLPAVDVTTGKPWDGAA
jgi:hypothetical protein